MTTKNYYVDPVDFYEACKAYLQECERAEDEDSPKPRMPEYIGACILKIATKLSFSRNFLRYPFREDMICDGVQDCIMYFHNFDYIKYKNPFSYFTQISYYAFLNRIKREKKQMYVVHKLILNKISENTLSDYQDVDLAEKFDLTVDTNVTNSDYMNDFVGAFERKLLENRTRVLAKKRGIIEELNSTDQPE